MHRYAFFKLKPINLAIIFLQNMDIYKKLYKYAQQGGYNYQSLVDDYLSETPENQDLFLAQIGLSKDEDMDMDMQLVAQFAQMNGVNPEEIMQRLQQLPPDQQKVAIEEMRMSMEKGTPQQMKGGGRIPTDPMGYKRHDPAETPALHVPSSRITMEDINYPIDAYGAKSGKYYGTMQPDMDYQFPEDIIEKPVVAQTGTYLRSLSDAQIDLLKQRFGRNWRNTKVIDMMEYLKSAPNMLDDIDVVEDAPMRTERGSGNRRNRPRPEQNTTDQLRPGSSGRRRRNAPITLDDPVQTPPSQFPMTQKVRGKTNNYNLEFTDSVDGVPFYSDEYGNRWKRNPDGTFGVIQKAEQTPATAPNAETPAPKPARANGSVAKPVVTPASNVPTNRDIDDVPEIDKRAFSYMPTEDFENGDFEIPKAPLAPGETAPDPRDQYAANIAAADLDQIPEVGEIAGLEEEQAVSDAAMDAQINAARQFQFRNNNVLRNTLLNADLVRAHDQISLPYRARNRFSSVELPELDATPVINAIWNQTRASAANINPNSTAGQAAMAAMNAKALEEIGKVTNQYAQQNREIATRNAASAREAIDRGYNADQVANRQYMDDLDRSYAARDLAIQRANQAVYNAQNMDNTRRAKIDALLMENPRLSESSTALDRILGNRTIDMDTSLNLVPPEVDLDEEIEKLTNTPAKKGWTINDKIKARLGKKKKKAY